MSLKDQIKNYAYELGADLVGFGSVDRCRHAPIMMSPQGIFPGSKTVVVMAIHHPDAVIERGGEKHPQEIGPYTVQYLMNSRLDEMSYRMASFIERLGHGAIPIVSSNIWRYNEYKELKAVFAPDLSHIYMAVVAGLADLGYNGLALTPEYGARNRFITVITDAEIESDPLIPPGSICDQCMLCRKHCPSGALSKEIDGDKVLKIDPYEYRFPNKNLWRCAWGEHFDLDLDLEIPEQVTEQVILDNVKAHGIRGGEMGQCLKFCVPKAIRSYDKAYSKTPMRVYPSVTDPARMSRAAIDRLLAKALSRGLDLAIVSDAAALKASGVDVEAILPGARSAITLAVRPPAGGADSYFRFGAQYQVDSCCYDVTRGLEELGYRALMSIERGGKLPELSPALKLTEQLLAGLPGLLPGLANTVLTRLELPAQRRLPAGPLVQPDHGNAQASFTSSLETLARELGADLFGAAPATRLDDLARQLRPHFAGVERLEAGDKSHRFKPWDPVVSVKPVTVKTAADWLPGARSVLVFGLRFHQEVLRWATRPPAEAVGPYSYETYVTNWLGAVIGYRLVQRLETAGYRAALVADVTGTDSSTASPRGPQPDLLSNRFVGVAAGLGWLADSGHLVTPQFGIRQRVIAIVTDAPLAASPPLSAPAGADRCAQCEAKPCRATCPTQSLDGVRVTLSCEGASYSYLAADAKRCDWCKRYALVGECGFKYLGSPADVPAPAVITPEALAAAVRQHDPIKKYRPVVAEPCVINCPLAAERS